MTLPDTPQKWAFHLSKLLGEVSRLHGIDQFPVNVGSIAIEYSRQVYPDDPIISIDGGDFTDFEGALIPLPNKEKGWGIIYNQQMNSGRKNFTLAHELGHYLLHRKDRPEGLKCVPRDMLEWDSEYAKMESEANTFASFLLMPLDDFRKQIESQDVTMDLMTYLADRYGVSLSAAILKWLQICEKRAMVVFAKEGYIDWAWSSPRLLKSGVFYRARQEVIELPAQSLAALRNPLLDNRFGTVHKSGVWLGDEEVQEMTILGNNDNLTISLLIYPDIPPSKYPTQMEDEDKVTDSYDTIMWLNSRR